MFDMEFWKGQGGGCNEDQAGVRVFDMQDARIGPRNNIR
jgi:hypothetical protein